MSSLIYPASLPGLTFNSVRSPNFNTGIQQALSGKESRIAYQQYTLMTWELQYELLRDYVAPSDLRALVGLFIAVQGKWDTFLYNDPVFNSVSSMPFGVTDGSTLNFPVTATYQNTGGPGGAELIQNFNGTPLFGVNRYGTLIEYPDCGSARTQYCLFSQAYNNAYWGKANLSVGSASQLAPDGTSTAQLLTDTSSSSVVHSLGQIFTVGAGPTAYTFSAFFWTGAVEGQFLTLEIQDTTGSSISVVFEKTGAIISTAVSGTTLSGAGGQINQATTESGSLWYRISLAFTYSGSGGPLTGYIIPSSSATSQAYAGTNGTASAVLWGVQFENAVAYPTSGPGAGGAYPYMYLPTAGAAVVTQADASLGPTGILTITSNGFGANAGITLLWWGAFYYRVRFDDDNMDVSQFMQNFWEAKKIRIKSVKV